MNNFIEHDISSGTIMAECHTEHENALTYCKTKFKLVGMMSPGQVVRTVFDDFSSGKVKHSASLLFFFLFDLDRANSIAYNSRQFSVHMIVNYNLCLYVA